MSKVMFLTNRQFKKRFPKAKKGRIRACEPRPLWRNPAQFQIKHPEWTLCHGISAYYVSITAWLEKGSQVLELDTIPQNIYFKVVLGGMGAKGWAEFVANYSQPKSKFYEEKHIGSVKRYSVVMARAMLNEHRTYGPWKDNEESDSYSHGASGKRAA